MIGGFPHPIQQQLLKVKEHFIGCTSVSYMSPFMVVGWPILLMKPWPLTMVGIPLYYVTLDNKGPPIFGKAGGSASILDEPAHQLKPWMLYYFVEIKLLPFD